MKRTICALAAAAAMFTASAPAVTAMQSEMMMLTGAIYHELRSRGLPTEGIMDLTLSEVARLQQVLSSGDSAGEMKSQAERILMKK